MDKDALLPDSIEPRASLKTQLDNALLTQIRTFRISYLPLIMIYFASGALGLIMPVAAFILFGRRVKRDWKALAT